ncbi:hypothetical protein KA107_03165 [Candidatus Pacearchaeota archaeon]|nr:hypothetical protein [Candidatus Pacearchaeota archaeon]
MSRISDYDLMIGRDNVFHSGACARDQGQPISLYQRPVGRVIIGTVRFDKDGVLIEDSPALTVPLSQQSLEFNLETDAMKIESSPEKK